MSAAAVYDLSAVAADLAAAGLRANVESAGSVSYVAASRGQVEVFIDDDGYTEVRWWNRPTATAAEVSAGVAGVVAAIAPLSEPPDSPPATGDERKRPPTDMTDCGRRAD